MTTETTLKPWTTEPDQSDFTAAGLPCAIRRNADMWFLCGYVGVPEKHPLHGLGVDERLPSDGLAKRPLDLQRTGVIDLVAEMLDPAREVTTLPLRMWFEAHKGITFAGVMPGLAPEFWWFGFDCMHAGDLLPRLAPGGSPELDAIMAGLMPQGDAEYRDFAYVEAEVRGLAEQLAAYPFAPPSRILGGLVSNTVDRQD